MKQITRREFLKKGSFLAFLLGLVSLAKTQFKDAKSFAEEATHVICTYGDAEGWYNYNRSEIAPRWTWYRERARKKGRASGQTWHRLNS